MSSHCHNNPLTYSARLSKAHDDVVRRASSSCGTIPEVSTGTRLYMGSTILWWRPSLSSAPKPLCGFVCRIDSWDRRSCTLVVAIIDSDVRSYLAFVLHMTKLLIKLYHTNSQHPRRRTAEPTERASARVAVSCDFTQRGAAHAQAACTAVPAVFICACFPPLTCSSTPHTTPPHDATHTISSCARLALAALPLATTRDAQRTIASTSAARASKSACAADATAWPNCTTNGHTREPTVCAADAMAWPAERTICHA